MTMAQKISDEGVARASVVIPSVELTGSLAERLRTLDTSIAHLHTLRRSMAGDLPDAPPYELHGPYLHAPVWPWFAAGWVIGALFVLMFVFARMLA
jgi:hypothetical protein